MTACSPILVAATLATASVSSQTPTPPQQITAVGCVTRNGVVDVNKGTRLLNMDPDGLALTNARLLEAGGNRASAVPGSAPDGRNTGTIPRDTIVGNRTDGPDTLSFALTGNQVKGLDTYVGRRVEIVGRLATPLGTADATAHPSAELAKLEVTSFRGTTGGCQ